MLQAAAQGAVDFSRADPREEWWQRRVRIACYGVEKANAAAVRALETARAHAFLARIDLTDESYKHFQGESRRLIDEVRRLCFPWLQTERPANEREIASLEAQWIQAWGDPRDPAVRARIEATAQALEAGNRKGKGR